MFSPILGPLVSESRFLWLFLILRCFLLHAAVLPSNPQNLHQANLTLATFGEDVEIYCSGDESWVDSQPFFDPKDCFGSIYYMMDKENTWPGRPERPALFVAHQANPMGLEAQATPRKYDPCKSCGIVFDWRTITMVIMYKYTDIGTRRLLYLDNHDAVILFLGRFTKRNRAVHTRQRCLFLRSYWSSCRLGVRHLCQATEIARLGPTW